MIRFYSESDFNNIKNRMTEFNLSDDTKNIILEIMDKVGSPNYIKTPNFQKKNKKRDNCSVDFKKTVVNNSKGVDVLFNQLRINLNKITSKTYSKIKDDILINIKEILHDSNEEYKERITQQFIAACSSQFICELTVKLFVCVINEFNLRNILIMELDERMCFFNNIKWFDPNTEYDKFCEQNKKNEETRGFCLFIMTLVKFEILEIDYICNLLIEIFKLFDELLNLENNKEIVQELSEQIYIIISNGNEYLKKCDCWYIIENRIHQITKMKNNTYKSISNKTIFKFMDLDEQLMSGIK